MTLGIAIFWTLIIAAGLIFADVFTYVFGFIISVLIDTGYLIYEKIRGKI